MITSLLLSVFGISGTEKIDKLKFPNSISEFRTISLGNFEQTILIRGENITNPIILFIHGGPGMAGLLPGIKEVAASHIQSMFRISPANK